MGLQGGLGGPWKGLGGRKGGVVFGGTEVGVVCGSVAGQRVARGAVGGDRVVMVVVGGRDAGAGSGGEDVGAAETAPGTSPHAGQARMGASGGTGPTPSRGVEHVMLGGQLLLGGGVR